MPQNATRKKAMLEALEQHLGVVTVAAKYADVNRATHYRWLKEDAEYREAVEELANVALDFGESRLHNLIRSGNAAATIFFLKTKGKGRGYVEGIEVTNYNPDGPPKWFTGDDIEQ
jgi:hypothetical protein